MRNQHRSHYPQSPHRTVVFNVYVIYVIVFVLHILVVLTISNFRITFYFSIALSAQSIMFRQIMSLACLSLHNRIYRNSKSLHCTHNLPEITVEVVFGYFLSRHQWLTIKQTPLLHYEALSPTFSIHPYTTVICRSCTFALLTFAAFNIRSVALTRFSGLILSLFCALVLLRYEALTHSRFQSR